MALVTRPQPSVSHKKRQAQHHRHNKHYLSTYWPYLPMLAIVGIGAVVNKLWPAGALPSVSSGAAVQTLTRAEPLTRVQVLAGSPAPAILEVVTLVAVAAFALFAFRHWRRLHRYLNRGEVFVYEHAWVDVAAVFVFTAGFVLTRTAL